MSASVKCFAVRQNGETNLHHIAHGKRDVAGCFHDGMRHGFEFAFRHVGVRAAHTYGGNGIAREIEDGRREAAVVRLGLLAIDGPSGAGKSSLAKALAKDLGYVYVDTGAMYRSIGLYAVRAGVDPHDADAVAALLPQVKLGIRLIDGAQHIYLNGEDVSTAIRAEEIGMAASAVAAHPAVRSFLLDTQRGLAESQNILMDGRDIGTVVLPNATVKIFLTASAEARAQRRAKELAEKGQPADFATVLADIRQRDYQDSHRAVAPLKQADDAILVDTSSIGLQESFDLLKRTILAHI